MIKNSDQSSIHSTTSDYSSDEGGNNEEYILQEIPSTIRWSQTLESVTLHINVNHVQVMITERYLKLSTTNQNITLPLYSSLYIQQFDIEQMMDNKLDTIYLTLEKESPIIWPHLMMQQTDKEVTSYLLEAGFLIQIQTLPNIQYDTLDFETIINSDGQKTGLE